MLSMNNSLILSTFIVQTICTICEDQFKEEPENLNHKPSESVTQMFVQGALQYIYKKIFDRKLPAAHDRFAPSHILTFSIMKQ